MNGHLLGVAFMVIFSGIGFVATGGVIAVFFGDDRGHAIVGVGHLFIAIGIGVAAIGAVA